MPRRALANAVPAAPRRAGRRGFQVMAEMGGAAVGASAVGASSATDEDRRFAQTGWYYYQAVEEMRATADFLGACLSRVVLRPGWLGDDDKPGPLFDEDGRVREDVDLPDGVPELAARLIRALRTVPGGQSALMKALGQNLAVPADCFLVGTEITRNGRGYGRNFEVLSTDELRAARDRKRADGSPVWMRYDKPSSAGGEELPPDAFVLRIWDPHPRFRRRANPFAASALTSLEGMRLLGLEQLSIARSRLAGPGVYWIADDIDLPTAEGDDSPEDAFTKAWIRVASTAIGDPGSAAASVPIIQRAPVDSIQNGIRLDRFDLTDNRTVERRDALVDTFARGAPVPPEVVKGHQQTTFANAFAISEDTFRIYVASPLELICGHVSTGYLHPSLLRDFAADGDADPALVEALGRVVCWFDASDLVAHPDRAKNAARAVGTATNPSFLISEDASRRYMGFRGSDAPDDEEIERRMLQAQALRTARVLDVPEDGEGDGVREVRTEPTTENGTNANGTASLAVQLAHAADYAADRAIERLRSRVADRLKHDATVTTAQRNDLLALPASDLVRHLGPERVQRMVGADMWAGEFGAFERKAREWAKAAGHSRPEQVGLRAKAMVERLAAERLFDGSVGLSAGQVAAMLGAKA